MTTTIETHKNSTEEKVFPAALVTYLDGHKLNERVGEAILVTTVDEDGWPHVSLLSVGEILATDERHLNVALHAQASAARNIERSGKLNLSMVHEGALWEVTLDAKSVTAPKDVGKLAFFIAAVNKVRVHRVGYADVLTSVTYSLHEKAAVVDRWERQIADLRALTAA